MAYFECIIGSGSSTAIPLIVTCSSNFAGITITASKTGAKTQTQTCPSSSPYEVTFILPEDGTWTISGIVSGQTFSETVTILPYEASLIAIPEGSTVLPTDDIQTWLHCASIFNKSYTTISQVLADASTLQALIASNNAVDYMVRSTTWATTVTANSSTMTYIGLNNYCSDKLLDDATWCTSICNSTYFENVLNCKVPTMTSETSPSGSVIYSRARTGTAYRAYQAFDSNASTIWQDYPFGASSSPQPFIGYIFTNLCLLKKVVFTYIYPGSTNPKNDITLKIQGSVDGSTSWTDISQTISIQQATGSTERTAIFEANNADYKAYRALFTSYENEGSGNYSVSMAAMQFYCRKDV